tara:strand:- start:1254 stop:1754 length:501 start_codon:yes stop_codon:yes gene_type:complete
MTNIKLVADNQEKVEASRKLLLSIPTPTMANINLVHDLNHIEGVTVQGLDIHIKDSNAAMSAHDVINIYLTPLDKSDLEKRIDKWQYLFYKPYNSDMTEVEKRSVAIVEELSVLPADCVQYALNNAIRNYKIFPSFSEVYAILKPHYERRVFFQTKIDKVLDELQQ